MRPPAIERMGYYPTDDPVVEIIGTYMKQPIENGRLFDPCAGEGRTAATLGQALNCETWGVELSPDRAEKAQQVMDKVYQAPWQACFLSDESISWLYLTRLIRRTASLITPLKAVGQASDLNGTFSKPPPPS